MKKIFTFLIILLLTGTAEYTAKGVETGAKQTGTITLKIRNFEDNSGYVFAHLYKPNSGFPTETKNAIQKGKTSIHNKTATIVFKNVPFGSYAVTTHHDSNNNQKMDKSWLGYPAEGFGISNNVKIVLSAPDFEESSFKLNSANKVVVIKMKYL